MDKLERIQSIYDYLRGTGQVHTRKDLAEKVGATPSNVASALRGEPRCLTDNLLRRINQAFGYIFNERWLITGEGEMMAESSDGSEREEPTDIRDRVLYVSASKGVNVSNLENMLGLSRSYFRNTKSISANAVARFLRVFPEVSADWLLTGQGEMLRQPSESTEPSVWASFISLVTDEVRRKMRDE